MNPPEVSFVNGLVNWQVQSHEQVVELAVELLVSGSYIGGFAFQVLTCGNTSHGFVEFGTAIAAIHVNRFSPGFPQGVKYVIDQCGKVVDYLL
jgi:hypothetical protein